ncbi:hypothetical protein E1264_14100 [Actinomadura sp. KC216]|uniref:hypothetical protein n=1 Tax=Actinomadura sp. KC216 TaxID=2530370 RepID=UPI00104F7D73|nr:hypothetical protein [Actinomadura sp. KC216]TDB87612.1 hypothetical protein E1264_14100 [Actinomadura sp. KC216]
MPTKEHEVPLEMVRNQPQLAPTILRTVFGIDLPEEAPASVASESTPGLNPAELRCDATILLDGPEDPTWGIIVESQLRYDKEKSFSWPGYLALLRGRHKCPVILLVFCPNSATAQACAKPIDMGHPEWVLKPLTFHPGMLPPVTDVEEARRLPELSVLSTPVHSEGPHAKSVLTSVAAAIDALSRDSGELYDDYLKGRLSEAAREILEEIVKTAGYEWQSDFAKSHIARGRAEGEAKMLLLMLEARGVAIPDDVRKRVTDCTDTAQLERWAKRAAVIEDARDLFD